MELQENLTESNYSVSAICALPVSSYVTEPRAVTIARLTMEICAALIGVLGNILVCALAPKGRKLRSSDGFYIRSLAIADIAILLVNFPIAVIKEQSPLNWPIGKAMCYFLYPCAEIFHGASIWSIIAIAVERYLGIVHGIHQSAKSTKFTITAIWLGSFALFVTPLLFIIRYDVHACGTFCYFDWPSGLNGIYIVLDTILLYVLPLFVITFTYVRITKEINVSSNLHKELSLLAVLKDEDMKRIKQNARTKRLLTPLVIVFSITMLPLNVFRVVLLCWTGFSQYKLFLVFYNIAVIGVVLNCAADPIIYTIVTKNFISKLKYYRGFGKLPKTTSFVSTMRNNGPGLVTQTDV